MNFGTVLWYDPRPEKRFGKIQMDQTGLEVFFHLNQQRPFEAGKKFPEFGLPSTATRTPKQGDRLAFAIVNGPKGPKADPWGFESDYKATEQAIAHRPAPSRYRVWQRTWTCGESPNDVEPVLIWGGSDGGTLEQLCAKFPRTRQYDDLRPFSCSDFNTNSWIEEKVGDTWVSVSRDPRPENCGTRSRW